MMGYAKENTQEILLRNLETYMRDGYFPIREVSKRQEGLSIISEGNKAILKDGEELHRSKVVINFSLVGMEDTVTVSIRFYKPDIEAQTTVSLNFFEMFLNSLLNGGVIFFNGYTDVHLLLTEPSSDRSENDFIMRNLLTTPEIKIKRTANKLKITIY